MHADGDLLLSLTDEEYESELGMRPLQIKKLKRALEGETERGCSARGKGRAQKATALVASSAHVHTTAIIPHSPLQHTMPSSLPARPPPLLPPPLLLPPLPPLLAPISLTAPMTS